MQWPCITALSGSVIRVGFIADDERFPHFAAGAADRRVVSVLSIPMVSGTAVLGTLNLYSEERDAFDDRSEELGRIFCEEAAMILGQSELVSEAEALRRRLQEEHDDDSRISTAQGVLMGVHGLSAEQALAMIHSASDANGEPLLDAAQRIITNTGEAGTQVHTDLDYPPDEP
jgi:transcriptional regulator with GAF, ATPase, and Fis domain